MELSRLTPATLRAQTIGADAVVQTPFGERPLVYADFTASGRQLSFVEDYLRSLAPLYANSHTEDSLTGRTATHLLHQAEQAIKDAVHAGPSGRVICCGNGSTGAIHKLQEILGVAIPPATLREIEARLSDGETRDRSVLEDLRASGPVVFVGPYEHHSNEVMWREGLCTVIEVGLTESGQICLDDLTRHLTDLRWDGRALFGSFSAGSNVTGVLAPVHDIARVLHEHGALAFFDYAAAGPYVEIDMTPDGDPDGDPDGRLDAIFLSPHKFLGGPGSSGLLVFDEAIYPDDLAPTVGGGGTVAYVNATMHDYIDDIEARETAGTPGFYQTLRAALSMQIKAEVGVRAIHEREHAHLNRVLDRWGADPRIEILGPGADVPRLPILSFNVRSETVGLLHPRFVTLLLCDLFGIQSRAGCSCAGPYGHHLLGISDHMSDRFRKCMADGIHGLKPGWARIGFHYTHDDAEVEYLIRAVEFAAEHGHRFLPLYTFEVESGAWVLRDSRPTPPSVALEDVIAGRASLDIGTSVGPDRQRLFEAALAEAEQTANTLPASSVSGHLDETLADLQFFALPA